MSIQALSGNYASTAVYNAPQSKVDSAVEALQGEEAKKSPSKDSIEISEEGKNQASKTKGLSAIEYYPGRFRQSCSGNL